MTRRSRTLRRRLLATTASLATLLLPAACSQAATVPHPRLLLTGTVLGHLQAEASSGSADWKSLKQFCDDFTGVPVASVDDDASDSGPSNDYGSQIGPGYEGSDYQDALMSLLLCDRALASASPARAASYGDEAVKVLEVMSTPPGSSDPAPEPLADDGYGIRNYVPAMAFGYDWLYDQLSAADRTRIVAAIDRWVDDFEHGDSFDSGNPGFNYGFPVGNYAAGFYAAKGLGALATEGDNTDPALAWDTGTDSFIGYQDDSVQPYFQANLAGGGWPQGWNYGPLATINQSLPAVGALSAGKDSLLAPGTSHAYDFPVQAARLLPYLFWPDLITMEDTDTVHDGPAPSLVPSWLLPTETGVLSALGDSFAPVLRSFTAASTAAQAGDADQYDERTRWTRFLFDALGDDTTSTSDYHQLPLSHYAPGIEDAYVRSSWDTSAVWGMLKGGPYIDYPDNGEETFDKGELEIVNGALPFLVDESGWLARDDPGTNDGSDYDQPIYDDLFGSGEHRDLFNIFQTGTTAPIGQSALLRTAFDGYTGGNTAHMTGFEDGGDYVVVRDGGLQQDYPSEAKVSAWTRDLTYLRPGLFIVDDHTTVANPSIDQWLAWGLPSDPTVVAGQPAGVDRYDVTSHPVDSAATAYAGTVDTVLPAAHTDRVDNLFAGAPDCGGDGNCGGKAFRLETRPATGAASENWLTVFDAEPSGADAYTAHQLVAADAGRIGVQQGPLQGVLLTANGSHSENIAVLGDGSGLGPVPATSALTVTVAGGAATEVLVRDLTPGQSYTVDPSPAGDGTAVTLTPVTGGTVTATAAGVVELTVTPRASTGTGTGTPGTGTSTDPGSGTTNTGTTTTAPTATTTTTAPDTTTTTKSTATPPGTATTPATTRAATPAPATTTQARTPAEACHPPRLTGLSLTAARTRIRRAGCTLGTVTTPHRDDGRRPLVVVRVTIRGPRVSLTLGPKPARHRPS